MNSLIVIRNLAAMADPNSDMLGIAIVIVEFFVFAIILTALFNRIANSKSAKLWPRLTPVIHGSFHRGIGLKDPYVIGNYRDLPVRARVRAKVSSRWNAEYYFEILASSGKGGGDWELRHHPSSGETQGWELKAKDAGLKQRLSQSGLMALVSNREFGTSFKYDGGQGTLHYSRRISTRDGLPSPEDFESQLDLLMRLANINRRANEELGGHNKPGY